MPGSHVGIRSENVFYPGNIMLPLMVLLIAHAAAEFQYLHSIHKEDENHLDGQPRVVSRQEIEELFQKFRSKSEDQTKNSYSESVKRKSQAWKKPSQALDGVLGRFVKSAAAIHLNGQGKSRKKRSSDSADTPEKSNPAECSDDEPQSYYPVPRKEEWYPTYHLAPPEGWMNDPNGLIYFEGRYHAFFQHNPYSPHPENINWGHAVSSNMVEWEHLPVALAPSIDEDRDGCFSGSAVNDNGTLTVLYTGNAEVQTTCLATSTDGVNFIKHGKVLDPPEGVRHFRDPKVWKGEDGYWYMVMGAKINDHGEARLYRSPDLHQWEFEQVIAKADANMGYMWECPDFFPLDDKHLLAFSPQGIQAVGYNYRNLYQSGFFVGTWQPGSPFNIEVDFTEMDKGHDFYAPQSFLAPDNRRIMMAWMAMWDSPMPENQQGWSGMLTLPRELTFTKDGSLRVNPVREIENFRCTSTYRSRTVLKSQSLRLECDARAMEIVTVWNQSASDAERYGLRLGDADNTAGGLYIYADNQARTLTLDRRYPQYGVIGTRSIFLIEKDPITLRVFLDHSSVEVFVDDGRRTFSSRIYPGPDERFLSIFAENGQAVLESSSRWSICARTDMSSGREQVLK